MSCWGLASWFTLYSPQRTVLNQPYLNSTTVSVNRAEYIIYGYLFGLHSVRDGVRTSCSDYASVVSVLLLRGFEYVVLLRPTTVIRAIGRLHKENSGSTRRRWVRK